MRLILLLFCIPLILTHAEAKKLRHQPLSIHIVYNTHQLRTHHEPLEFGIEAIMPDSSVQKTRNLGGKLNDQNFEISVTSAELKWGKIHFPEHGSNNVLLTVRCVDYPAVVSTIILKKHQPVQILPSINLLGPSAPEEKIVFEIKALYLNDFGEEQLICLPIRDFHIGVQGGRLSGNQITIESDPDLIQDHQVSLFITPYSGELPTQKVYIPLFYNKDYRFRVDGSSGSNGSAGSSGNNHCAGQNGQNGHQGSHGSSIQATVKGYWDEQLNRTMLDVYVSSSYKNRHFLINPEGGSLWLYSDGGDGGRGGDGGDGADGSNGENGRITKTEKVNADGSKETIERQESGQNGTNGTDGGDGGFGGDGGNGGNITIYYNEMAHPYLDLIFVRNDGGSGGRAGSGGDGGDGGAGGKGSPNGHDGKDGNKGRCGRSGQSGYQGQVIWIPLENDPFIHLLPHQTQFSPPQRRR